MKKIIAVLMLVALAFTVVSCGAANKTEVAVLWHDLSDGFSAELADAVDRGMYIENIKYTHYDAKGSALDQVEQAKDAVDAGAPALLVNCKLDTTAALIIAVAKEANIPVVFIASNLSDATLALYDKCYSIELDLTSLYVTLGERIAKDLIANYDKYDRNGDGAISYVALGLSIASVETVNAKLEAAGKADLKLVVHNPLDSAENIINDLFKGYDGSGNEVNETPVELIISDNDADIESMLLALRTYEINYQKLNTHFLPLYTVGTSANAGQLIDTDDEEERAAYSVMSAIDDGFLSAAALEDDDTLAETAARVLRNLLKEKEAFNKIDKALTPEGNKVSVKYTIYG